MHSPPLCNTIDTTKVLSASLPPAGMPYQLLYFLAQSTEPWAVKDTSFHFLYVNQAYIDSLQIPPDIANHISDFSYEGVPSLAALKEKLVMHDQKVLQSGQRMEAVCTVLTGSHYQSFIFEKFPFFNKQGNITGTVSHLKPLKRFSLGYFLDMPFYGTATFVPPTSLFSRREWEILFLLYRGFNRTQISRTLNISENYSRNVISRLSLKTGVNSKEQLLELGLSQGWHLYVPPGFVSARYDLLAEENFSL